MNKQAMVLGLGQFGMAVARSLSARGVEVLAVDAEPERVEQARVWPASRTSSTVSPHQSP